MGLGLIVILTVLTFLLVVPAATLRVVVRARGAFGAILVWYLAVRTGLVVGFDGPLGLPVTVAWSGAVVIGVMWLWSFGTLGVSAWSKASEEMRMWKAARENIEGF